MAWWNKVFGGSGEVGRVAYYDEGLALMAEDKVHEALTSFRLALKAAPVMSWCFSRSRWPTHESG